MYNLIPNCIHGCDAGNLIQKDGRGQLPRIFSCGLFSNYPITPSHPSLCMVVDDFKKPYLKVGSQAPPRYSIENPSTIKNENYLNPIKLYINLVSM